MAGWKDQVVSCVFEGLLRMVQWEKTHESKDTCVSLPFVYFLNYPSSSLLCRHEADNDKMLWVEGQENS